MTQPDPDNLLELAERKEARAMRKWNDKFICPRGIKRVCRLRREAAALRARSSNDQGTEREL